MVESGERWDPCMTETGAGKGVNNSCESKLPVFYCSKGRQGGLSGLRCQRVQIGAKEGKMKVGVNDLE